MPGNLLIMNIHYYYIFATLFAMYPTFLLFSKKFNLTIFKKLNTKFFRENYLYFYILNLFFTFTLSDYYQLSLKAQVSTIFPEYFRKYFLLILVMGFVNMILCKIINDLTKKEETSN